MLAHPSRLSFSFLALSCLGSLAAQQADLRRTDLQFLVDAIKRTHPEPYARHPEPEWTSAIAAAESAAATADDAGWFLHLRRIVGLLEDGHSQLLPVGPAATASPLHIEFFADGAYVVGTHPSAADLLGGRIVAVGDKTLDDALAALAPYACADNPRGALVFFAVMLRMPAVHRALGFVAPDAEPSFTVRAGDAERRVRLPAAEPMGPDTFAPPPPSWLRVACEGAPRGQRSPELNYWFEHDAGARLVYLRLRAMQNHAGETLRQLCERMFALIAEQKPDKLVIDLRGNRGGNNGLAQPLVHGVIKSALDAPGRVFVLTDHRTFSAAMNTASRLERDTWALFAGAPTGARPNHFGDATTITLPQSGYLLFCSTLRWQDSEPADRRPWICPDLPAEMTFADYQAGRDPALDACLAFAPKQIMGYTGVSPWAHWRRSTQRRTWPPAR